MNEINNEKRCLAHQIIHDLHNEGELGQIQMLHMATSLSYKSLNREKFLDSCRNEIQTAEAHAKHKDKSNE